MYLKSFNKTSGIFAVYYISSGHFGASLVILASYFLVFRSDEKILSHKVLLAGVFLGLFAIYISAARSPLLAIFLVWAYFLILKNKIKYILFFLIFLLFVAFFIYFSRNILHIESAFVERNYLFIFEGNTSGREPYFNRAIAIFKVNPLIGGRVLYEDGMYPHNIFLELLMSGGLLLLVLFCSFFFYLIKRIKCYFNFSDSNFYIIPLFSLWFQYFILAQTSYNIHSNPEFWYFSSVIMGITTNFYNEKT